MKTPKPQKLPSGSFRIVLTLGGERISITRPDPEACTRAAELMKAQFRNGIKAAPTGGALRLGDAIDQYIADRQNVLSPSTIVGYKDIRRNRFKSVMMKPISAINWQRAVDLEARDASPKTVKNAFGFCASVLRENGLEMPPVRLPAAIKPEKAWLSPEQIRIFVHAVHGEKCEIPALLALHSLRKSEVCGLEWSDLDLKHGLINVRGAKLINDDGEWVKRSQNKTMASARAVPVFIPQLTAALKAVPEAQRVGYVVKVHPETPYRQIQKICSEGGLPLVGWHGLRHSFASLCYSLGINELTCMELGGWSDYGTMRKIYTHLSENDRKKSADKLAAFFENAHEIAHDKTESQ